MSEPDYLGHGQAFAMSRLGQVAALLHEEAARIEHGPLQRVADICLRRGHDPDEEVELLVQAVLFTYARDRGIDVFALPQIRPN